MEYTIEQFKEDFEDAPTIEMKHELMSNALEKFDLTDPDIASVISDYKYFLIEIKKEMDKEENDICDLSIERGEYELFTCVKSNDDLQEGNSYYVKFDDVKSSLGEMWSEVATDEMKQFINSMKPTIWVIVDDGIGSLKRRIVFKENFDSYFKR